jgi:hypothetical protein
MAAAKQATAMNTDEQSIQLLTALARRLRDDPRYMAHVLAVYQQAERLDDAALANSLGAAPEMLLRLALCRRPEAHAPDFAGQVRTLADYTLLDETQLARVIRRVDELHQAAATVEKTAWPRRFWIWLSEGAHHTWARQSSLAFTAAACLLLFVLAGLLGWALRALPARAPQITRQPQSTTPTAITPATPAATAGASDQLAVNTQRRAAPPSITYEINLEDWATQRAAGAPGKKEAIVIKPPLESVQFRLKLFETSTRGFYRVSLIDAAGKPLLPHTAHSRDGVNLVVRMNLSSLAPGDYLLRVEREGEAPAGCPVRISN